MANICRHFKALNRKNQIVYRRTPACALFELVLPCALMGIMVWLRSMVEIKHTDLEALEKYKHPLFPGLKYSDRFGWQWDPDTVTNFEQTFMNFVDYHPTPPIHPGGPHAPEHAPYNGDLFGENQDDSQQTYELNQGKNKNNNLDAKS